MLTKATPAARNALVVGGGIAGMSSAISLSEAGVEVDLIDIDPDWKVYGAGITITGPTLRAMKRLDILDRVMAEGWTADGLLACDARGAVVAEIDTSDNALDGVPGAGGILRPTLHRILAERVRSAGIRVSLGRSVSALSDGQPRSVTFSDGTRASYDLVVAADGIFSSTRRALFPEMPAPNYVGQVCWRLMTERHPLITRRTYFLGGPMKVGMNPVSRDGMYMFLLEPVREVARVPEAELHSRLAELMTPYGGIVADVREKLSAQSVIVARPLETVFVPRPWHRDGVILVGDAAHATTPQLASGAGMAMEDGIVLGESIGSAASVNEALDAFMRRRFDRCALVVESSLQLGKLERAGSSPIEQVKVVEDALRKLNEPY